MKTFEVSNHLTTQYISDYLIAIFEESEDDDDSMVIREGLRQAVITAGIDKVANDLGYEHPSDLAYILAPGSPELGIDTVMKLLKYFKLNLAVTAKA